MSLQRSCSQLEGKMMNTQKYFKIINIKGNFAIWEIKLDNTNHQPLED